jgi:plasmid stability protein
MSATLKLEQVPEATLRVLEARARLHGRTIEEEAIDTLAQVTGEGGPSARLDGLKRAAVVREEIRARIGGKLPTPSEVLLREDRDAR